MKITLQSGVELKRANYYSRFTEWYSRYKSRYEGVYGRIDDLITHIKRSNENN